MMPIGENGQSGQRIVRVSLEQTRLSRACRPLWCYDRLIDFRHRIQVILLESASAPCALATAALFRVLCIRIGVWVGLEFAQAFVIVAFVLLGSAYALYV